MSTKLSDTVWSFLDKAGPIYGQMEHERFRHEMHANCLECGMQSPIEHLFWIATWLLCKANYEEFNPDPEFDKAGEPIPGYGVTLWPQAKVGKYRVDFMLTLHERHQEHPSVVVELDGHDFHDKDKHQRSYEKGRDRALVKAGLKVIHYTGSDVVRDPFACAHEALELAGLHFDGAYNQKDPLGLGQ